jgi:hypothetical protein
MRMNIFARASLVGLRMRSLSSSYIVVVSSMSSVSFIYTLSANKHALHDIRFRFIIDNIWIVISTNHPDLRPNEVSKDIS